MNLHQFGARHTNGGPRLFLGVVARILYVVCRISYIIYRISRRQERSIYDFQLSIFDCYLKPACACLPVRVCLCVSARRQVRTQTGRKTQIANRKSLLAGWRDGRVKKNQISSFKLAGKWGIIFIVINALLKTRQNVENLFRRI